MRYRSLALIVTALTSAPLASAAAQSVYVAPGGIYIGAGPVYVTPAPNGAQPYLPPTATGAAVVVAPSPDYAPTVATGPYGNGYYGNGPYGNGTYRNGTYVTYGNGTYAAPETVYEEPVVRAYSYVPPRRAYAPPFAVYGANARVAPGPYVVRERTYVRPPVYAADDEVVPRPRAAVPYPRYSRCVTNGRYQVCN